MNGAEVFLFHPTADAGANAGVPDSEPAGSPPASDQAQVSPGAPQGLSQGATGGSHGPGPDHPRFKEIYRAWKEAERQVEDLRAQLNAAGGAQLPSGMADTPSRSQPQSATTDTEGAGLRIDTAIAEWEQYLRDHYDDSAAQTKAWSKIAELKAEKVLQSGFKQLAEQQQRVQLENEFVATRQQSWNRALNDFPELGDPNSELFKAAAHLYNSDKWLKLIPQGEYFAAQAAYSSAAGAKAGADDRFKSVSRLESPGSSGPRGRSSSIDTKEALKSGDFASVVEANIVDKR